MASPLFCPFCGECFEGRTRCPDHELPLVDFEELEKTRAKLAPDDDLPVEVYSAAYGRGLLMAAAGLWCLGFAMPFVAIPERGALSGFALASSKALNLWMVPGLAVAILSVLGRRRTPLAMRSARVAVLVLTAGVGFSLGFTLYRVFSTTNALVAVSYTHLTLPTTPYV